MVIATKVDAIRRTELIGGKRTHIVLKIPYIPAARQDRLCDSGEPLTSKVYADFLNSLDVDEILTVEPHSDVLPALLNNCFTIEVEEVMPWDTIFKKDNIILVSPDGGAIKRTGRVMKYLDSQGYTNDRWFDIVYADKDRDPITGKINNIVVQDKSGPEGGSIFDSDLYPDQQYIVVDDVGAMCGTFLGLHDKLKGRGAKHIDIVLAHIDCNRNGLPDLCEKFDNVYVTNSQSDYCSGGNLTVVDVL